MKQLLAKPLLQFTLVDIMKPRYIEKPMKMLQNSFGMSMKK